MDRYEEALERAKQGKPIEEVFPELKESEDEKTRKMIKNVLRDAVDAEFISETSYRKMSAFLEEHKTKIDACGFPIRDKGESASSYLERCLAPDMRGIWYEACAEIKGASQVQTPAGKLIAEIERTRQEMIDKGEQYGLHDAETIRRTVISTCEDLLNFAASLQQEQPEVDLEKEIDDWYNTMGIPVTADALKETARYFYDMGQTNQYQKDRLGFAKLKAKEWQKGFDEGINARKEESK